jgi:hypothetical protein
MRGERVEEFCRERDQSRRRKRIKTADDAEDEERRRTFASEAVEERHYGNDSIDERVVSAISSQV